MAAVTTSANEVPAANPFSLDGRTALVVGASRGIGLAIAQAFAEAGARTILGARSADLLADRVAELPGAGLEAEWIEIDATEHTGVACALDGLPPSTSWCPCRGINAPEAVHRPS